MITLKPQRGGQTTGGCKINSSAPPAVLGLSSFAEHFGDSLSSSMHRAFGKDNAFDAFLSLSINIKTSLRIAFGKGF